jgi:hypothetical protein
MDLKQNLLEDNQAAIREAIDEGEGNGESGRLYLIESCKSRFGVDIEKICLREGGGVKRINWKKFCEASRKLSRETLKEAISEPTFTQLTRAAVNLIADEWYQLVPTDFEKCFQVTASKYWEELYPPMYRGGAPVRLAEQEPFRGTNLVGLDIKIRNWKFGAMLPIARELMEDDQTGQVTARVQDLAQNMKLVQENWAMQRWIGTSAAAQVGQDTIPASETYSGGVYSTSLSSGPAGTSSNRLTTYSAFSELNLQALDVLAMNMYDQNGNKILVNPNLCLTGTSIKFSAEILLSNANPYYASTVPSQLVDAGSKQTTTNIGTTYAKNVMAGRYEVVTNRFLPATCYGIMERGKGLVVQMRIPVELTMEDPNAGESFRRDSYVWRSRSRFNVDWIEPRFSFLGNDGTV